MTSQKPPNLMPPISTNMWKRMYPLHINMNTNIGQRRYPLLAATMSPDM